MRTPDHSILHDCNMFCLDHFHTKTMTLDLLGAKVIKIESFNIPGIGKDVKTNEHTLIVYPNGTMTFLQNIGLDVQNTQTLHIPENDPGRADFKPQYSFAEIFNCSSVATYTTHPKVMEGRAFRLFPVELEIYNRDGVIVFAYLVLGLIQKEIGTYNIFILKDHAQPFDYRIIEDKKGKIFERRWRQLNLPKAVPLKRRFYPKGIDLVSWSKASVRMGELLARQDALNRREAISRGDVDDLASERLEWLVEYAQLIYEYPNLITSNEYGWIDVEATARWIHDSLAIQRADRDLRIRGFFSAGNLEQIKAKRRECVEQLVLAKIGSRWILPEQFLDLVKERIIPVSIGAKIATEMFKVSGWRFREENREALHVFCIEMEHLGIELGFGELGRIIEGDTLMTQPVALNSAC